MTQVEYEQNCDAIALRVAKEIERVQAQIKQDFLPDRITILFPDFTVDTRIYTRKDINFLRGECRGQS